MIKAPSVFFSNEQTGGRHFLVKKRVKLVSWTTFVNSGLSYELNFDLVIKIIRRATFNLRFRIFPNMTTSYLRKANNFFKNKLWEAVEGQCCDHTVNDKQLTTILEQFRGLVTCFRCWLYWGRKTWETQEKNPSSPTIELKIHGTLTPMCLVWNRMKPYFTSRHACFTSRHARL